MRAIVVDRYPIAELDLALCRRAEAKQIHEMTVIPQHLAYGVERCKKVGMDKTQNQHMTRCRIAAKRGFQGLANERHFIMCWIVRRAERHVATGTEAAAVAA